MNEERINRPYIPEFSQPGAHPDAPQRLAPDAKASRPDKFQQILQKLGRIAEAGDLGAWKKTMPEMEAAAKEANVDLARDLATRVTLKQCELTLFVQAGKLARSQARYAELKANDAQIGEQGDQARTLFQRAQKFNELANYLTQQLRSKTA